MQLAHGWYARCGTTGRLRSQALFDATAPLATAELANPPLATATGGAPSVRALADHLRAAGGKLVVAGGCFDREAPKAYGMFQKKRDGAIKVVFQPHAAGAPT